MFSEHSNRHRYPAVAGQFYPADREQLNAMVSDLLQQAESKPDSPVKALIAPHAGYIYSGPIAASVYRLLSAQSESIRRVVLLGPSHHVGFHGLATSSADYFSTPLGDVRVDRESIDAIEKLAQVQQRDDAHAREHCLEVQLPFLQSVLADFSLVPLVVGDSPAQQVAEVVEQLWGGTETLIVVSSDLSHYLPYQTARENDRLTSAAIVSLKPEQIQYQDACGRNPVNGLLVAARRHQLKSRLIDLRNSGDTAGSRDRVVGYGAYQFSEDV